MASVTSKTVHLLDGIDEDFFSGRTYGNCGIGWDAPPERRVATTRDPREVTCKSCKRTLFYKKLLDGGAVA